MTSTHSNWQQLARQTGGTIAGLGRAVSADGAVLLVAATSVGIFRSADTGRTWTLPEGSSRVALAEVVVPSARFSQDQTVFAGAADGLNRSSDGGVTWEQVLVGSRVLSVACSIVGRTESVVLVGTETDGVLRSEDSGRSWAGANPGLLDLSVMALELSPVFDSDRLGFAGTASGLYRTRNGARSWRLVETGLEDPAVQCLAVSPTFKGDRLVLAGTEADGLLRSVDAGATWHRPPSLIDGGVTALAFAAAFPTHPAIAAATESGIAVSHDAGTTWRAAAALPAPALSLIFVARESGTGEVLLAGLLGHGVFRSEDYGATWEPANEGLNARMLVELALSPAFVKDQTLFVAGPNDGVRVSVDGGRTWMERSDELDESIFGLAISPDYAEDHTLYAAAEGGVYVSRDAGMSWQRSPVSGSPRNVTTARSSTGKPVVLAVMPGGIVLMSDNGARTWRGLPAAFDAAEIMGLAVSPDFARDRTLFVGTTTGAETVLWRSRDGGEGWERWLVAPGRRNLLPLAVSPDYSVDEVVFAGLGGRVLKSLRHAHEVHAGKLRPVWHGVVLEQDGVAITALAVSPNFQQDRTVFAATNVGMFVSRDGGDSYCAWSDGLDLPRLMAIAISPNYARDRLVYALGLGGTLWRRNDQSSSVRAGSG